MHKVRFPVHIVIQGEIELTPAGKLRMIANRDEIDRRVAQAANQIVHDVVCDEEKPKPDVEPGLPLRQFIRGFLRDHMGLSKIASHLLADLFMKRWNERDEKRARRYAREDQHTLEATRAREAADWMDQNTERA